MALPSCLFTKLLQKVYLLIVRVTPIETFSQLDQQAKNWLRHVTNVHPPLQSFIPYVHYREQVLGIIGNTSAI